MKRREVFHCIMFNYHGRGFISTFTHRNRLSLRCMTKRFFQLTIDEGKSLGAVTDVEFLIDGNPILGASDGAFLHRHFFALGRSCSTVPADCCSNS